MVGGNWVKCLLLLSDVSMDTFRTHMFIKHVHKVWLISKYRTTRIVSVPLRPYLFLIKTYKDSTYYHQTPWYPCFNLKIGIIWSFSQNYHQKPWYPCFNLKVGIIWSFSQNYHQTPWYPCFNLKIVFLGFFLLAQMCSCKFWKIFSGVSWSLNRCHL